MNDGTILKIDSLRKSFYRGKNQDEELSILNGLELELSEGRITALIGGNGTGKTTLFNIISGFVKPDSGTIAFRSNGDWLNIKDSKPFEIARSGIGRMFQDNHIFPNMTVVENMLVADNRLFGENPFEPFAFFGKNGEFEQSRNKKALKIFKELFGDDNPFTLKKDEPAHRLSYGQQRLLGLARLFMADYKLLLLDEPTSGVSPDFVTKIKELMRVLENEKRTVLLIEHNWKFVLETAGFCHFMSRGQIEISGTPEDIIGNPEVRRTYMGV